MDEGETCDKHHLPGHSAIHVAASLGYTSIIQRLLREDLTSKVPQNITPMQLAAENGHLDCLEALLDFDRTVHDANSSTNKRIGAGGSHSFRLDQRNKNVVDDKSSLDRTMLQLDEALSERIIFDNLEETAESAIYPLDLDYPEKVSEYVNADNGPVLHLATASKHRDIVTLCIRRGAHLGARDWYGCTALHVAAENGHSEITKMLIESGADINSRSYSGETVAMRAAINGNIDILKILYHKNADFDLKDPCGRDVLDHALQSGRVNTVSYLMAFGQKISWNPRWFCPPVCKSLDVGSSELGFFLVDFMPDCFVECSMCGPLLANIIELTLEILRYCENMLESSEETTCST